MTPWIRHHAQSAAASLRRLGRAPLALALNVVAVGIALALPLGGYLILENLGALADRIGAEPQISVFFAMDADKSEIDRVAAELKRAPGVRAVRFVPRDEALRAIQQSEGISDILSNLKTNPLPDAFVADLAPGETGAAEQLATALRGMPKVARVQFDAAWARRVGGMLRLGRLAVALLGVVLAVGLVAVTFNAVRLQILTRRSEIELAGLVGATDAYIRRPFLYQGATLGLLGGSAAAAIILGMAALLDREVTNVAQTYGSEFRLILLPLRDWGALLTFSAAIGWGGAYASVSRYLHSPGRE
ncbi:MAG: permease-like cell division protein FtsX [Burkholderiales bacterium]